MSQVDPSRIGKFDRELFARYRASKPGPPKRAMLNQLLVENMPLVKTLVDQLCGRGEAKRKAVKLGGCQGFRDIEWEDALVAGQMAFMKAMDGFNAEKGKLPFYLLLKIRYELQVIVSNELHLARVPRGKEKEAVGVDLVGEQRALDEMGGSEIGGIGVAPDLVSPEEMQQWSEGRWGRDPRRILSERRMRARWAARTEELEERRPIDPADPVASFLKLRCSLGPSARESEWVLHNAFRIECRRAGAEELDRPEFLRAAFAVAPLRRVQIYARNRPDARGVAGVRLLSEAC